MWLVRGKGQFRRMTKASRENLSEFGRANCQGSASKEDVHQISIFSIKKSKNRAEVSFPPLLRRGVSLIRPICLDDREFGRGPLGSRLL